MNTEFLDPFENPFDKDFEEISWSNEAFKKLIQMIGEHNGSHTVTIAGFGDNHIYSGGMIHSDEVDYRVELI